MLAGASQAGTSFLRISRIQLLTSVAFGYMEPKRGPDTDGTQPSLRPNYLIDLIGAPSGARTRVFAVKGRRPGPLDDGRNACELQTPGGSGARHCYRGACSRAQGVRAMPPAGRVARRRKRRPNSRLPAIAANRMEPHWRDKRGCGGDIRPT